MCIGAILRVGRAVHGRASPGLCVFVRRALDGVPQRCLVAQPPSTRCGCFRFSSLGAERLILNAILHSPTFDSDTPFDVDLFGRLRATWVNTAQICGESPEAWPKPSGTGRLSLKAPEFGGRCQPPIFAGRLWRVSCDFGFGVFNHDPVSTVPAHQRPIEGVVLMNHRWYTCRARPPSAAVRVGALRRQQAMGAASCAPTCDPIAERCVASGLTEHTTQIAVGEERSTQSRPQREEPPRVIADPVFGGGAATFMPIMYGLPSSLRCSQ